MLRCTVLACAFLASTGANCQELGLSKFGFQEVFLNMPYSGIPPAYKGDCGSGGDKRFVFCTLKAQAGAVPMTIEVTVVNERVVEIQAYFPVQEFDTVWSALRQKYGQEDKRDATKVEWYTNPMHPDKPIPDELVLLRRPKEPPKVDGSYYIESVEYGVIHYESFAITRDSMRRKQEEREQKVKGVAGKL